MFQTVVAVLIGMTFLYFVLAVLCSGVKEFIAAKLNWRAKTLEAGIGQMLAGAQRDGAATLLQDFYDHPLIRDLAPPEKKPSYIPAQYFSATLEAVLKARQIGSADLPALIRNLPNGDLKNKLSAVVTQAGNDVDAARKAVEDWFDSTMDRVSGWYKRRAQKVMLVIAFALVIVVNADSFAVFRALWQSSALRDTVVDAARNARSDTTVAQAKTDLAKLPLGWSTNRPLTEVSYDAVWNQFTANIQKPNWWVSALITLLGWGMSAFAATLGAPFWFDAMGKLINMRTSGAPPQKDAAGPPTTNIVVQTQPPRTMAAKA